MTTTRVNEIDFLRFCAALSVVFFHYAFRGYAADQMSVMPYPLLAPFAKYGYLGVELFFMISGFVILMTASNGSLRGFVVSRVIRLYPAFWACCTITFVVMLVIGGVRYSASLGQYLINMTMLSDFLGVPSLDGVYWSLFVEMRFYALVAVLLVLGIIHQAQLILMFWLIASIALTILPIPWLGSFLLVDYSAYFIAGATYFLIWLRGISLTSVGVVSLSWGLALFQSVTALPRFERHFNTHMSGVMVAGIITSFFLVMLVVALRRTGYWGRQRWVLVGALTYPLYLLHQNIGFMVFNAVYPAVNPHLLFWGTIFGVIGVAYAVHVLVEKKFSLSMKGGMNSLLDTIQRRARIH